MPKAVDCTIAEPSQTLPLGEWLKRGYVLASGRKLPPEEVNDPASLLLPAGLYGPAFLAPKNYFVLKDYNFSDLYVLFVGHLGDRIMSAKPFETPWENIAQLKSTQLAAMQKRMTELGLYRDKIDGKAGMLTRAALGAYQKQNGLTLDCWPTSAVLDHMTTRERNSRATAPLKSKRPGDAGPFRFSRTNRSDQYPPSGQKKRGRP